MLSLRYNLVGKRVRVYWAGEDKWFEGESLGEGPCGAHAGSFVGGRGSDAAAVAAAPANAGTVASFEEQESRHVKYDDKTEGRVHLSLEYFHLLPAASLVHAAAGEGAASVSAPATATAQPGPASTPARTEASGPRAAQNRPAALKRRTDATAALPAVGVVSGDSGLEEDKEVPGVARPAKRQHLQVPAAAAAEPTGAASPPLETTEEIVIDWDDGLEEVQQQQELPPPQLQQPRIAALRTAVWDLHQALAEGKRRLPEARWVYLEMGTDAVKKALNKARLLLLLGGAEGAGAGAPPWGPDDAHLHSKLQTLVRACDGMRCLYLNAGHPPLAVLTGELQRQAQALLDLNLIPPD